MLYVLLSWRYELSTSYALHSTLKRYILMQIINNKYTKYNKVNVGNYSY